MAKCEAAAETSVLLEFKKSVLKVSIHCEACRKEVHKILKKVEGVYKVDIDAKQQKVTVTTGGNVDVETLIKKLIKSGKHAQLWPEEAYQKEKKSSKSNNKDKKSDNPQNSTTTADAAACQGEDGQEKKQAVKLEQVQEPAKINRVASNNEVADGSTSCGDHNDGGAQSVKESKSDQSPPSMVDKMGGEKCDGGADKGTTNSNGGENKGNNAEGGPRNQKAGPSQTSDPTNTSHPHQHGYQYYPPDYYAPPPPPIYSVSYNMVYHPSSSYTTSYQASTPSYSSYSYPSPIENSASDLDLHPRQPSDSFEMFSDENPNACSIM